MPSTDRQGSATALDFSEEPAKSRATAMGLHIWSFAVAAALLLAGTSPALGQEQDLPTQLWLSFQHQHKAGEKGRLFGTLGYEELLSQESFWGQWNTLYVEIGGSYDLGERFRISGGGGLYYTYHPENSNVFELRLWQEGTAFWPDNLGVIRRWVFAHRLRFEERLIESDGSEFALRLRYRLDTKIPLNTYTLESGTFYLPLAVELFADLASEASELFAERNRASIGLGYVADENWTVVLNYHRQGSRSTIEEEFSNSFHVIELKVETSFRIRDLVKGR